MRTTRIAPNAAARTRPTNERLCCDASEARDDQQGELDVAHTERSGPEQTQDEDERDERARRGVPCARRPRAVARRIGPWPGPRSCSECGARPGRRRRERRGHHRAPTRALDERGVHVDSRHGEEDGTEERRTEHAGSPHGARGSAVARAFTVSVGSPTSRRSTSGSRGKPPPSPIRSSPLAWACRPGSPASTATAVACAARVERELAGVDGVEVEGLAAREGGFVGERDELASLDECATDVDRCTDDDEEKARQRSMPATSTAPRSSRSRRVMARTPLRGGSGSGRRARRRRRSPGQFRSLRRAGCAPDRRLRGRRREGRSRGRTRRRASLERLSRLCPRTIDGRGGSDLCGGCRGCLHGGADRVAGRLLGCEPTLLDTREERNEEEQGNQHACERISRRPAPAHPPGERAPTGSSWRRLRCRVALERQACARTDGGKQQRQREQPWSVSLDGDRHLVAALGGCRT